jgi:hypothetical protein
MSFQLLGRAQPKGLAFATFIERMEKLARFGQVQQALLAWG